ncbi:MAG: response regulator, partial [Bacteroidota bacterium]
MKTILLIEDNVEILDNLKEYMELAGYPILTASSGEEGLEMALKYHPDLIVCD